AAGFNLYEAGARATALGGAFTASADDGSALFYNPAGLSFQNGVKVSLNFMPVNPRFKFAGATTDFQEGSNAEAAHKSYLIPGAYYTNSANDRIAYGIGLYAPFGLGVEWMDPYRFAGRFVSYDVDIKTIYITPALSFKLGRNLALAIGADIGAQELSLERVTPHPTLGVNAIDTHIEGKSKLNVTPTVGLMYRPGNKLSFGFMYHHKKTMDYEDQETTLKNMLQPGQAGYDWSHPLLSTLNGGHPTDLVHPLISSEFNLPAIMSFGAAYQVSSRVRAEVNYVHFGWSTFSKLEMDFNVEELDQDIAFDYKDSGQVRAGLDIDAVQDKLKVMLGYVHDETPQPLSAVSPLLPDSDRNDYSIGLQLKQDSWEFTACWMTVLAKGRTTIENGEPTNENSSYPVGTYKSVANIFGAGIGYHF
ncbi:hypothetical protein CSA17_04570, partial [bacterium DOLJORAL78_65_58]